MSDRRRLRFIVSGAWRRLLLMPLSFALTGCGAQTTGGRWRIWVWIVILVLLAAVTVLLISAIVAWQKRMARVRYRLELHNEGNVASRYALQAEAPEGGLDFLFLLRGMALSGGTAARAENTEERAASSGSMTPRPGKRRGKGFLNFASTISGLLISVGNLLPYDVGIHLIRIGSKLRRGQGTAERMGRASGQMSRQVGEVGGTQSAPGRPTRPSPAEPSSPPVSSWVETPSVAPGETLTLELLVSPENPYRAQRRSCVLRSRALEQADDEASHPHVVRQDVDLAGLTSFQTYGPFLLLLVGVIMVLVTALMLIEG